MVFLTLKNITDFHIQIWRGYEAIDSCCRQLDSQNLIFVVCFLTFFSLARSTRVFCHFLCSLLFSQFSAVRFVKMEYMEADGDATAGKMY